MSDFSSEDSELSDFSISDDTDFEDMLEERIRPKNINFFEETIPQYNDEEFMEHFRVSRQVGAEIAERFGTSDFFSRQSGPHGKLTALQHTYIFLWFSGHQTACFRDVSDRFNITISCLHRVLKRMTYFLSNLAPEVIYWPNEEEKTNIKEHFVQNNGFPGILGVIDGTHIKIDKPTEDPESYINRKGFYSIQTQLVCDHQLKIRDLFTGYPGSVHDARVFRTSPLFESLENKCQNHHIIGDSAYPLLPNLLTPFKDRGLLNINQLNYNVKLSSNRILIEHCNGLLKQKWRQLYHVKLRNIETIVHFIRACCVLHNLAIGDNFNVNFDGYNEPEPLMNDGREEAENNINGVQKRNHIVNIL